VATINVTASFSTRILNLRLHLDDWSDEIVWQSFNTYKRSTTIPTEIADFFFSVGLVLLLLATFKRLTDRCPQEGPVQLTD
jgi:hypothetical protein